MLPPALPLSARAAAQAMARAFPPTVATGELLGHPLATPKLRHRPEASTRPTGPAAGAVPAAPSADLNASSGQFSVATYNVHGLPWVRPKYKRMAPYLRQYDFVFFQESFLGRKRAARAMGYNHNSRRNGGLWLGDGLARFSDSPFRDFDREKWNSCNGIFRHKNDCLAPKGFSVARHRLGSHPGATVLIYNLHMDAGRAGSDQKARERQVTQLLNHIGTHAQNEAVLVVGDFNLKQMDQATTDRLLRTELLTDTCGGTCSEPYNIDKILYRSSPTLELRPKSWTLRDDMVDGKGKPLSDHDAVAVEFDWRMRVP